MLGFILGFMICFGIRAVMRLIIKDEASADENGETIQTNYEQGAFDEIDISNSFDNFIMFLDIKEYDFWGGF